MKMILCLAVLSLAACSSAKSEQVDYRAQSKAWMASELVKQGKTPAEAQRQVELMSEDLDNLKYDPGTQTRVAKRQREIAQVKSAACGSDPGLSYC